MSIIHCDDPTPTPAQHRRNVAAWNRLWRTIDRLGLPTKPHQALFDSLAAALDEQRRQDRCGARALAEHRRRRHR